jgi:DNA-binding NtrC family response regulator
VSKTVLIVDDEEATAWALAESLRDEGFSTATAASAAQAVAAHTARPADLIITDLRLPDLDGFALLERLARSDRAPLAIVISAWDGPEIRERFVKSGALACVRKPFNVDEVKDLVARSFAGTAHGPDVRRGER